MADEGGIRENRIYLIIAVFILVVIIFAVFFSSNQIEPAYIPDKFFLDDDWGENVSCRSSDSQLFGLEKSCSLTYEIDGKYPAYLTIHTRKSLIMANENELRDRIIVSIENALQHGVVINKSTKISGERALKNAHESMYIIYDGEDASVDPAEKIKIIGEVWNCGLSGTSIMCIGVAQITDYSNDNSTGYMNYWKEIVSDENGFINNFVGENGLIFNVVCH